MDHPSSIGQIRGLTPLYPKSHSDIKESLPNLKKEFRDALSNISEKIRKRETLASSGKRSKDLNIEAPTLEEEVAPIILDDENHRVFHSLIGTIYDRHITLPQVKTLLGTLKCSIIASEGKGRHQKAKAPTGGSWIIPEEWDGPIPNYYRQQLSHFFQYTMDIDPITVVVK